MWPNPQKTADFVTFTEETFKENFIFYAVIVVQQIPNSPQEWSKHEDFRILSLTLSWRRPLP